MTKDLRTMTKDLKTMTKDECIATLRLMGWLRYSIHTYFHPTSNHHIRFMSNYARSYMQPKGMLDHSYEGVINWAIENE